MIFREQLRLYLVTDSIFVYPIPWLESIEAAIDGGVTLVQYRQPLLAGRELYETGRQLADLLKLKKIPLVVNNDAALAVALNADALHLGQSDLPPEMARRVVGAEMSIGFSITAVEELPTADPAVVDHLGVGPVFDAKKSKADAADPIGIDGLRTLCSLTELPVVAIGGIGLKEVADLIAAGADGLAIVSALSRLESPRKIAELFRKEIDKNRGFPPFIS